MRIDVLTLFPQMFAPVLSESILKSASANGLIEVQVHDIRDAAGDKHHTVDDTPYGGGTGMVLKVDVVDAALKDCIASANQTVKPLIILMTPQGERFKAEVAENLAEVPWIILICGHYEGFDERIRKHLADKQISIGDYVLTGGELPAMVLIDAIARFVPGVLPAGAPQEDSHSIISDGNRALEYPQYTRPSEYNGWSVPEELLSGNHGEIEKWRKDNTKSIEK